MLTRIWGALHGPNRARAATVVIASALAVGLVGSAAWATVEKPKPPSYYDAQAMIDAATVRPNGWDYTHLVDDGGAATYIWDNFQRAVDVCMARRGFAGYVPPALPFAPLGSVSGDGKSTINPVNEARYRPATPATDAYFSGLSPTDKTRYASTLRGTNVYTGFVASAEDGVNVWSPKPTTSSAACEGLAQSLIVEPAYPAAANIALASDEMADLYYTPSSTSLEANWAACMGQRSYQVDSFSETQTALETGIVQTKNSAPSMTAEQQEAAWSQLESQFVAISNADSSCRTQTGVTNFYQSTVMPTWNRIVENRLVDAYRAIGAAGLAKAMSGNEM